MDFLVHTATFVAIYSLLAISLNLQYGLTGLVNFGMMLFFGTGAYASATVVFHGWPLWLIPVIALAMAVLSALVVSLPARRMEQDYWALVTFGAQEVFRLVMLNQDRIAGGAFGTGGIPRIIPDARIYALMLVVLVVVAYLMVERIRRSAFGRVIRVIREDEVLAASLGREVYLFQLRAMILGVILAALAGIAYAHYMTFVNPEAFMPVETFFIWTMLILGGTGNTLGAILGAAILETISMSTRFIANYTGLPADVLGNFRIIVYGLLLMALVMFRPQGILPERKQVFHVGD
jgi:branched-chain amino acid transport system permease protein